MLNAYANNATIAAALASIGWNGPTEQLPILGQGVQMVLPVLAAAPVSGFSSIMDLTPAIGLFVVAATVPAGHTWTIKNIVLGTASVPLAGNSQIGTRPSLPAPSGTSRKLGYGNAVNGYLSLFWQGSITLGPGSAVGAFSTGNAGDTVVPFELHYVLDAMVGQ